jgi:hypothetical protein
MLKYLNHLHQKRSNVLKHNYLECSFQKKLKDFFVSQLYQCQYCRDIITHSKSRIMASSIKTYRFKVSNDDLCDEMVKFAHLHAYETKEELKENYEKWTADPEVSVMISNEEDYLQKNGYDFGKTSMKQKIFRSIKYYHIKNILKPTISKHVTDKTRQPMKNSQQGNLEIGEHQIPETHSKREYIAFTPKFVATMKTYVDTNIKTQSQFKPSVFLNHFVQSHSELVCREKSHILDRINERKTQLHTKDECCDKCCDLNLHLEEVEKVFQEKLKKSFKNVCFRTKMKMKLDKEVCTSG